MFKGLSGSIKNQKIKNLNNKIKKMVYFHAVLNVFKKIFIQSVGIAMLHLSGIIF